MGQSSHFQFGAKTTILQPVETRFIASLGGPRARHGRDRRAGKTRPAMMYDFSRYLSACARRKIFLNLFGGHIRLIIKVN